jgi:hypothetical protein
LDSPENSPSPKKHKIEDKEGKQNDLDTKNDRNLDDPQSIDLIASKGAENKNDNNINLNEKDLLVEDEQEEEVKEVKEVTQNDMDKENNLVPDSSGLDKDVRHDDNLVNKGHHEPLNINIATKGKMKGNKSKKKFHKQPIVLDEDIEDYEEKVTIQLELKRKSELLKAEENMQLKMIKVGR